jgi:hypothetical protein
MYGFSAFPECLDSKACAARERLEGHCSRTIYLNQKNQPPSLRPDTGQDVRGATGWLQGPRGEGCDPIVWTCRLSLPSRCACFEGVEGAVLAIIPLLRHGWRDQLDARDCQKQPPGKCRTVARTLCVPSLMRASSVSSLMLFSLLQVPDTRSRTRNWTLRVEEHLSPSTTAGHDAPESQLSPVSPVLADSTTVYHSFTERGMLT